MNPNAWLNKIYGLPLLHNTNFNEIYFVAKTRNSLQRRFNHRLPINKKFRSWLVCYCIQKGCYFKTQNHESPYLQKTCFQVKKKIEVLLQASTILDGSHMFDLMKTCPQDHNISISQIQCICSFFNNNHYQSK